MWLDICSFETSGGFHQNLLLIHENKHCHQLVIGLVVWDADTCALILVQITHKLGIDTFPNCLIEVPKPVLADLRSNPDLPLFYSIFTVFRRWKALSWRFFLTRHLKQANHLKQFWSVCHDPKVDIKFDINFYFDIKFSPV